MAKIALSKDDNKESSSCKFSHESGEPGSMPSIPMESCRGVHSDIRGQTRKMDYFPSREKDGSVGSPSILFLPQIENDCIWAKTIGLHMEKAASSVPP